MQGSVILRLSGVLLLAALLSACHPSMNSASGQTPVPSNTTAAQANSTAAPDLGLTMQPGDKYFAKTGASMHGVTFSIWANGRPVLSMMTPNESVNITPEMRGHANQVVVQWERTAKNGSGTLTIGTAQKTVLTAHVSEHSPVKGQVSKTFIAPQAKSGR